MRSGVCAHRVFWGAAENKKKLRLVVGLPHYSPFSFALFTLLATSSPTADVASLRQYVVMVASGTSGQVSGAPAGKSDLLLFSWTSRQWFQAKCCLSYNAAWRYASPAECSRN